MNCETYFFAKVSDDFHSGSLELIMISQPNFQGFGVSVGKAGNHSWVKHAPEPDQGCALLSIIFFKDACKFEGLFWLGNDGRTFLAFGTRRVARVLHR